MYTSNLLYLQIVTFIIYTICEHNCEHCIHREMLKYISSRLFLNVSRLLLQYNCTITITILLQYYSIAAILNIIHGDGTFSSVYNPCSVAAIRA